MKFMHWSVLYMYYIIKNVIRHLSNAYIYAESYHLGESSHYIMKISPLIKVGSYKEKDLQMYM